MRPAKWTHIILAISAVLTILALELKQPAPKGESSKAEIVSPQPREEMIEPLPLTDGAKARSEPTLPAERPRTQTPPARKQSRVFRQSRNPIDSLRTPASPAPAMASNDMRPFAQAPASVTTESPAAIKLETDPVIEKETQTELVTPGEPIRSAQEIEKRAVAEDRVHREVVALIKSYIAEHRTPANTDAYPVNLASTNNYARIDMPRQRGESMGGGPWVLGAMFGYHDQGRTSSPLLGEGFCSELFMGYEFTRWLQIGVNIGMNQMKSRDGEFPQPASLYQTDIQMRLFLRPSARVSPFALAGMGYAQDLTASLDAETERHILDKQTVPFGVLGAGVHVDISRRIGAQVALAYEHLQTGENDSGKKTKGHGVWELKAGLSFSVGEPRMITSRTGSGLAVIEPVPIQAEH